VSEKYTLRVKSHSVCENHTLRVEIVLYIKKINLLRVETTLVRVETTLVRVGITFVPVEITLPVEVTLCVYKSHSSVL
jgi:hypothetical protein